MGSRDVVIGGLPWLIRAQLQRNQAFRFDMHMAIAIGKALGGCLGSKSCGTSMLLELEIQPRKLALDFFIHKTLR